MNVKIIFRLGFRMKQTESVDLDRRARRRLCCTAGINMRGLMVVRYDARLESAPWNGVVVELKDAELQRKSTKQGNKI